MDTGASIAYNEPVKIEAASRLQLCNRLLNGPDTIARLKNRI
jgi:hypothetical protein